MQAIADREKGALPISIGTSLAIESILGIYPEVEGKPLPYRGDNPPILSIDTVWVNLRTLYRNLTGCIDREQRDTVDPMDLANALVSEMSSLEAAVSHGSKGRCSTVFYHCSYISINRRFPYGNHRNLSTEGQKNRWVMEEATLKEVMDLNPPVDFRTYDIDFDETNQNGLIITHYAVDLLNRYKFKRLSLLESHTGAIKPPSLWYTKLHPMDDLMVIPFDRMTLQVFGDSTMFKPAPIKIRRYLVEIAKKAGWTGVTTKAMIEKTLKDEHDPVLEAFVLKHY